MIVEGRHGEHGGDNGWSGPVIWDEHLIEALRQSDEAARHAAWDSLFRRLSEVATNKCRLLYNNSGYDPVELAHDALNEAILKLLAEIRKGRFEFKGERAMLGFLWKSVQTKVIDRVRWEKRRNWRRLFEELEPAKQKAPVGPVLVERDELNVPPDPERTLDIQQLLAAVRQELAGAPKRQVIFEGIVQYWLDPDPDTEGKDLDSYLCEELSINRDALHREKHRIKKTVERVQERIERRK